jgi:O-antigen/teichoic acid export membrane protein
MEIWQVILVSLFLIAVPFYIIMGWQLYRNYWLALLLYRSRKLGLKWVVWPFYLKLLKEVGREGTKKMSTG